MADDNYEIPDGLGTLDFRREKEKETEVEENQQPEKKGKTKKQSRETTSKKQYAFRLDDNVAKKLVEIEFFYKMHEDLNINRSQLVSDAIEQLHKKMLRKKKKIDNLED